MEKVGEREWETIYGQISSLEKVNTIYYENLWFVDEIRYLEVLPPNFSFDPGEPAFRLQSCLARTARIKLWIRA